MSVLASEVVWESLQREKNDIRNKHLRKLNNLNFNLISKSSLTSITEIYNLTLKAALFMEVTESSMYLQCWKSIWKEQPPNVISQL